MKKLLFSLLIFSVAFRAFPQCSPDTSINIVGFFPMDTLLPCIEQGIYFDEVLLFKNFSNVDGAAVGLPSGTNITIVSVQIDSVRNMPSGINYVCNTPDCFYTTGENGCVRLVGTTNDQPGVYNMGFFATLMVSLDGGVNSFPFQADSAMLASNGLGYRLVIVSPGGNCPNAEPGQLFFNASVISPFYCEGDTVPFHTLTSGGATPYSYSWSPGTNLSDPVAPSPMLYPTHPGTYFVTVTDDNGLTAVDSVAVEYAESPQILLTQDVTICAGDSIQLVASGGTDYSWSPATGLSATDISNPIAMPSQTTTYTVEVSEGNCAGTGNITVAIDESIPQASFNSIPGGLTVFFNNTSSDATGYHWDFGDGNVSTQLSPQHQYAQQTSYNVTLIATNDCGDSDTVTQTIDLSVGIRGISNDQLISIHPNPGTGMFQLNTNDMTSGKIYYEVISVCGEKITGETLLNQYGAIIQLDLTGREKGIYFVKVVSGTHASFGKIILQ